MSTLTEPIPPPDLPMFWKQELYDLVRRILERVASQGLSEPQRILIQFAIRYPGVELPDAAHDLEHDEMTIALQRDFSELTIDTEGFAVIFAGGSRPVRFRVPFAAIRRLADPAHGVGLLLASPARCIPITNSSTTAYSAVDRAGKIVNLDAFRSR